VLHRNLLLLSANNVPATKSIVRLSAPEAESIVDYFFTTMYGGQEPYGMNGHTIDSSMMIPGSTGISPSPTTIQHQNAGDLYGNGGANVKASLRTHSSKFPVSTRISVFFCSSRMKSIDKSSRVLCFPFDVMQRQRNQRRAKSMNFL
jgi:hypothetical protein